MPEPEEKKSDQIAAAADEISGAKRPVSSDLEPEVSTGEPAPEIGGNAPLSEAPASDDAAPKAEEPGADVADTDEESSKIEQEDLVEAAALEEVMTADEEVRQAGDLGVAEELAEEAEEEAEEDSAATRDELAEAEAEPEPEPEPEVAPAPPAPQPAPARGGFGPMVLGGVLAAVLGGGAAIWALPHLPAGLIAPAPAEPDPQVAQLKALIENQNAQITALNQQLSALKTAEPDLSGVEARLQDLENRPAPAAPTTGATDAEVSQLQAQIEQLKAMVDNPTQVVQEQVSAAAKAAQEKIADAEAQAAQLRAASEAAAKRTMAQAALARLGAALDAGAPIAPAVADLQAAGLSLPEVLAAPVPSLDALKGSFPQAARAGLAASRKALAGDGFGGKIKAFLLTQTGARSLSPQQGDGPDAVLSRAQGAVDQGDVATALAEIATLPEPGQAAMADWSAQAKARVAALAAVDSLAAQVK